MALSRTSLVCGRQCLEKVKNIARTSAAASAGRINETRSCEFRLISSSTVTYEKLAQAKVVQKYDWNRAVSEAEKIVGYPTSFLSLRWLLSDEIANVALHLRKLVGSNHPLLKKAKTFMYNDKNQQAWGLIVLLVSKAAGCATSIPEVEQDKSAGVLHSQRALAEVTEMMRTSHLIHQGMINLQTMDNAGNNLSGESDMIFGNKIALLGGDYLLASACQQIANLRNQDLNMLISSAYRDLTESNFIGDRDEQNNPLPSKPNSLMGGSTTPDCKLEELDFGDLANNTEPMTIEHVLGNPEKEWSLRHVLGGGSLLGKSCQGAMMLAGQSEELQKQGYLFGRHLSLAWQASIDLQLFLLGSLPHGAQFSLVSAPVLFHLEYDPSIYAEIEKGRALVDDIAYDELHRVIANGPGVEKTKNLMRKHSHAAMEVLERLSPSDARTALQNIILAMQEL
ncbi:all trans-polyprenyl-diphosphate synthase PDSS2-like [Toxorhynchites rutilus septentrionalis]|uniref:all trans-polyprenyl-diphosphate synthase PDSS2-like n=1 Tax=Toxorhynchites rutilus septentrionalis TaxID=329112 RepID=UPI002479FAB2|nr:all trans-polyprenyl-diphosphate synthase PDSS2-like [Toxorhynchites rutilus septentrionalis]